MIKVIAFVPPHEFKEINLDSAQEYHDFVNGLTEQNATVHTFESDSRRVNVVVAFPKELSVDGERVTYNGSIEHRMIMSLIMQLREKETELRSYIEMAQRK